MNDFSDLIALVMYEIKTNLTRDFDSGEVPEAVERLATEFEYGKEILPEIWVDDKYIVYVPENGSAADIRWNEIRNLPDDIQIFIGSYLSI